MNILLLGASTLAPGFKELGHNVLTCTTDGTGTIKIQEFPTSIQRVFALLPGGWYPDCILLTDDSTYPMFWGIEDLDLPLVWYAIDSHIHHAWHRAYAIIFDFIFLAQKDYLSLYERDSERQVVKWLPLFTFPLSPTIRPFPALYNLSFVGNVDSRCNPERRKFIEAIQERYPLNVATGEFVSIFTRSNMVLNQCASNDVNFRTFEAMACGSLLLMERIGNGLEELFQDKIHLVLYEKGNVDQVVDLARYYSQHSQERETIARRGQKEVLEKHTYVHRAQRIMAEILAKDTKQKIEQRLARLGEIRSVLTQVNAYVSALYESYVQYVTPEYKRFRELITIRDKYRLQAATLRTG